MKILVIDDKAKVQNHVRTVLLDALKKRQGIEYDIIEPKEEQLKEKLTNVSSYNLVIIDFRFDQPGSAIFRSGASLYSLIKDHTSSIPIYLISVLTSTTNQIGDFDLFINDTRLKDGNSFKKEIEDHILLKNCQTIEHFLTLLSAPEDTNEDLRLILKPLFSKVKFHSRDNEIPKESISQSLNLLLFQWLTQTLLRKEGFLVCKKGAAIALGISTQYFDAIAEKFDVAKYSGLFSGSFEERWWLTLLEDVVINIHDTNDLLSKHSFSEASSLLLGAKDDEDFSTCVVCSKKYPDSLGILAQGDPKDIHPVHTHCSELDESVVQESFFENLRLIAEGE
ncbi:MULTISPECIES: response regulator [Vibrio]|uniref:response regulator n=1 Tax=Vibrio TaxID=662 RepID=UPI00076B7F4C|nr:MULTISPECIES: response regulator [Vibrio]AMG01922.1 response regulator [Vibrio mimicus]EKF9206603.1 response regulator [Vibrio cholerae]EKF9436980.1 response regulator [Vibrio cholerae]EKF9627981.1 response regulator [Vibrio cholerae]EKF9651540.1 response regulator [Vibrio cholerae]